MSRSFVLPVTCLGILLLLAAESQALKIVALNPGSLPDPAALMQTVSSTVMGKVKQVQDLMGGLEKQKQGLLGDLMQQKQTALTALLQQKKGLLGGLLQPPAAKPNPPTTTMSMNHHRPAPPPPRPSAAAPCKSSPPMDSPLGEAVAVSFVTMDIPANGSSNLVKPAAAATAAAASNCSSV